MFIDGFDTGLLAATPSPYTGDLTEFLQHARRLSACFDFDTTQALRRLAAGETSHHQFLRIPVREPVPPTETAYVSRIPKRTFQSEGVIGAASLALGRLFGYEETSRHVMYDIYPVKGYEESRSFVNSRKMLAFHSDGSAHPQLSPDFVLLYCIRSDPQAVNLVADLDALLGGLPARVVELLRQPLFKHLVSQSPQRFALRPILFEEAGELAVRYDEENVTGLNAGATAAQDMLNERLRQVAVELHNAENSLLIINNRRSLHARGEFTPRFDGTDRWIKGAFVTRADVPDGTILRLGERRPAAGCGYAEADLE